MDGFLKTIAKIYTEFPTKFGIPRQSGLVSGLQGEIVFEPAFRDAAAVRGLEEFSHIWLLWGFSEVKKEEYSPTVRPPRLGGNQRMGVFATRSPYRPNPIGLSAVRLEKIVPDSQRGVVLVVSGADLMNGTPIYDIKPYLPYTDCRTDASGGFAERVFGQKLAVEIPGTVEKELSKRQLSSLRQILSDDPRPQYHNDPEREYGFVFSGLEIKFRVKENTLTVLSAEKKTKNEK